MGDFVLESSNDAVLLMGLSGLSVADAVAIIQNVAKKSSTFPTAGGHNSNSNSNRGGGGRGGSSSNIGEGDGDNSGGFNAENLSLSKMAYFEEYFNVTWTPSWDRSCSDATIQLLKLIEEKEGKEVNTKVPSRASAKTNQSGSSSSNSDNSNNSNDSALSDNLKKVTAGMVVYLKCSIDNAGFKDASDWDLINDVALCCATLLKVCSMKLLSYSYGFVNNNIIALIIAVSQSVCTKLSANKESAMLEGSYFSLLADHDIHEAHVNDQETSYSAASQVEMMDGDDDSAAKGGANAYSSRLRTRNTKVVYAESADSKSASSKRTFLSSPAANLVLAFINSNSLLDYVTSRNVEHITDIYLEMMFSAMYCMDHKSEEFCLDKENLALHHSTCESLLFVCVFSGEQSAMRFMRLVISVLTFSVRDCSIFPKEEKLKISFQKLVNEKIMTKFVQRLAVETKIDDTNASSSKRRTKASSSNSRKTNNSNNSRAASSGDESARLNILQDPIDRNAISVMMLGLLQRLLLSFNGEQKTSTRSIIQNCLSGLIDSIGTNLLSSQGNHAYSAEDRLIWSRMVSRFLKFVFKASKSTSHHLRYAATDLASLILHSCDWIWFSTSFDDLSTLEDMSSDWVVDNSSNQSNATATSLPKLLLITLLYRMNDSNASVRLKALNSIADLFQTIIAYAENENGNYDTLFSNESKSIEIGQLGKDEVLFLIKSQYLLRLCLGTNIVLLNPADPSSESATSSSSMSRSMQAVSLMEILRTRCDDLKSLIVAKSLFCYFHALSIKWIRVPTLRPLFLRWTYLNRRRQGLTTDMVVAEEGDNFYTNDDHDDAMEASRNENFYFDAVPLYIGEDDVTLISNYCSYSNSFNSNNTPTSISIRKQSIVSLTAVLKNRIENNLLAGAWVTSVMVAIADLENTVIDKAVVCIHDILIYSASNCRAIFERLLAENLSPADLALAIKHIKQFQMVINVCDFIMSSDKSVLLQKCVSVIMQSGRVSDIPGYSLASASNFGNHGSGGNVPNVDYNQLVDSVRFMCAFDQFKSKLLSATGSIANGNSEVIRLLDGFQESIMNSGWLLMESIMLGQFGGSNKHNYNIVSLGVGQQESKLASGRGKKGVASSRSSDSSEASGGSGTTEGSGNNELSFTLSSLLVSKSPQLTQVREFIESASHLKIINCIQASNSQQLLANLSEIFSVAFKEIILKARLMSDMILTNNDVKMLRILETLLLNSVNYQKMLCSNNTASTSFFDDLLFISVYVECLLIKGSTLSYTALSSALSIRFAISKIFASVTSEVFENGSSSNSSSKDAENRALRSYLSLLQWDLTRWARPLLSMSHFILYCHAFRTIRPAYACPFSSTASTSSGSSSQGCICNVSEGEMESIAKSLMHQLSIVELCNRSLFLLGEISILGFVSEEVESKVISLSLDSSGTSSVSNCSVNNDSNRIYIKIIVPEALVSIVQLYLGTTLPRSSTSSSSSSSSSSSASADGGVIVKTSDIVGADFDVTKIVTSTHLHDDRSNIASRCFAFISLGKLCIRSQALARSSLNLYLRELSLNSSDQTSRQRSENNDYYANDALAIQSRDNNRSNTLLVLGDLCVRHTNLVERHINQISLCLQPYFYDIDGSSSSFGDDNSAPAKIFNSILVRKHAFIVITQLLQQDYVKCSGELLLRLAATAANDPDAEMVEFSKLILKRTLLLRNPDALLSHVSEAVVFFNSCTSFSAFNYQMGGVAMDDSSQPLPASQLPATQSNDLDLLSQQNNDKSIFKFQSNGGANLNGPANRSNRLKCYALMLEDLTDEQKITVTVKIVNDILSSAIDILQSPKHLSNSSNNNNNSGSSNASEEYLSNFNSVIKDTFLILQSPLLKVGRKSQAQAQEELDIDGGDIGASQVPASQAGSNVDSSKLNNLKLKTLKALNKQVMINHVVPVVFSMKHILQKCKSPLQGWLMGYLMFLTKSHKVEMDQVLATDPIMKAEIEYELRHFDNDNDTQQQQKAALGVGSATVIQEAATISNRGDEQVNRRTSLERARHIAKVVSTAEKIHYSAKKDNMTAVAAAAGIASGGGRRSAGGGSSQSVSSSDTLSSGDKGASAGLTIIPSSMKLKSGRLSASGGGGGGDNDVKKVPSVRFTSISPSQDDAFPRQDDEPLGSRKGRNEKVLPEEAAAAVIDLDTLADRFTSSDKGFRRQATTHKRATSSAATKEVVEEFSAVTSSSTTGEDGPAGNEENVPRNKKISKKK